MLTLLCIITFIRFKFTYQLPCLMLVSVGKGLGFGQSYFNVNCIILHMNHLNKLRILLPNLYAQMLYIELFLGWLVVLLAY